MSHRTYLFTALALPALGAGVVLAQSAPWALGPAPEFARTLERWAKGDALKPGAAKIKALAYGGQFPGGEGSLGTGSVGADGRFTLALGDAAKFAAPLDQLCKGLESSAPALRVVNVDVLEVPALDQPGKHARPGGAVMVGSPPPAGERTVYSFFYADRDAKVRGKCDMGFDAGPSLFDLDLRKGWNVLAVTRTGFKTTALPTGVKWHFVNPLTAGR